MNEKEKALLGMKIALMRLRSAWAECAEAFSNCYIDCNDYILGNKEDASEYPFHTSFNEINVYEWACEAIRCIEKEMSK